MKVLGIIPARYASTRLPGKPLADIAGKPMIQHVWERAKPAFDDLIIATDDKRIAAAAENFGAQAVMTDPLHNSGTNRCLEAYQKFSEQKGPVDVIVNVQGDEPLVNPEELKKVIDLFKQPEVTMGTLAKLIDSKEELDNNTGCFLTLDKHQNALYFSRSLLPHLRDHARENWFGKHPFYKHIGLYGFRPESLKKFASLPQSSLEIAESLEQLRWLENGEQIKVALTSEDSISIDTPEDLAAVRALFK